MPPAPSDPFAPADLTRREVLTTVTVAGAAVALGGCTGAAHHGSPQTDAIPAGHGQRAAQTIAVSLSINGQQHRLDLEPRVTLLDALRDHVNLTGTKKGCDHGQCGACTVLLDGRRVDSCLILAVMAQGREITTIEGIARGDELHPVQSAFIEHDAFQCGYCTPGQICSAVGLINEGRAHSDHEIREAMAGNLCRCGAYQNIVAAVKQAIAHA